ncbi:hypothetical protein HanRHA438_Chr07g0309001 [Helianthus annuus]|uniref:Uncharacterized protein n=1 Tax=Helianthus annuus TaxID=4232 RepID=A0A251V4W8_HELAN|nr:hypothetical protein HanXRQr2_Chr07g0298711 [Helianthus annuus]KAJ0550458.1 hypothetical protein HanHA300_Chr07g0245671 [Helianthus annuus]KAJ0557197.1 hypothetical protein HanIR_Chr07g0322431 [Helianthus annuus]KAJ0563415.1 hypothetical protein HanHA89_Chr07g0262881 [Helianthus annuus]KAJ0728752.1 hypothetical protein HanLR1_Chr07g0245241 [Helianthus annuus]
MEREERETGREREIERERERERRWRRRDDGMRNPKLQNRSDLEEFLIRNLC